MTTSSVIICYVHTVKRKIFGNYQEVKDLFCPVRRIVQGGTRPSAKEDILKWREVKKLGTEKRGLCVEECIKECIPQKKNQY